MSYKIEIAGSEFAFTANPGETISQAAQRNLIQLKLACRQGACGTCKGKLLCGQVDDSNAKPFALTQQDKDNGLTLFCVAKPLSDIVIESSEAKRIEKPAEQFTVKIRELDFVTDDVVIMDLVRSDNGKFIFTAGQTIDFIVSDDTVRTYSAASASTQTDHLTLTIRHVPGGKFTDALFNGQYKVGSELTVNFPHGSFVYKTPKTKQAVFLVTGTGVAPVLSILHTLEQQKDLDGRDITVIWGGKTASDLFCSEELESFAKRFASVKYIPVVSRDPAWTGRKGRVQTAAAELFNDMSNVDVYLCGSTPMVNSATEYLMAERGLKKENTFSDAFGG